jgi:rhamnogalacturonan endolyase
MFITPFKFIAAFVVPVFGISLTKSDTSYMIDTNNSGGFAVAISRDNCDITSIVFRDTQYQYQSAFSHIASGLGSNATPSYTTTGKPISPPSSLWALGEVIKLGINYVLLDDTLIFTCTISDASFNLTQYYVFREGASSIYIATDTIDEPSVGELRMLGRLINLPNSYPEGIVSNTPSGTVLAEGDVWLVDGETRSKVST